MISTFPYMAATNPNISTKMEKKTWRCKGVPSSENCLKKYNGRLKRDGFALRKIENAKELLEII